VLRDRSGAAEIVRTCQIDSRDSAELTIFEVLPFEVAPRPLAMNLACIADEKGTGSVATRLLCVDRMSYTLTYQLSPERTRGLHGSPMNRPQAVNWANRTAAASPRSLRCAAIRAAPIASGTFPLHALRFGLQAPVSAQRRVRKVPPQAVRNLPHQKTSIHHATTLNVRDASRLSVIGVMPFPRSSVYSGKPFVLPPPTGALRSRGGYRRPAEALHTGYDLKEPRKTSRVVDFWQ
jgi:hypothetical protein